MGYSAHLRITKHNHTKMRKNMSLEIIGAPTHNHTKMRKNLSLKYMI